MVKNTHLWLLITAVVLLSIQILAVIVYIYSFVPLVWDDSFLKGLEPTRDSLFYVLFLGLNMGLMALGVKFVLPLFSSADFRGKLRLWLGMEAWWSFLVLFCFFKWTTYRYPFWNVLAYENQGWLRPFFCTVCVLAALSKIFFPEISRCFVLLRTKLAKGRPAGPYMTAMDAFFMVGIALLLYIPHPQDVAALSLVWDQWNHLDPVAGWFVRHGWYLNYEEIIQLLVLAGIVYSIGLFYFIRLWLGSRLLAAIGTLLVIKLGLFYYAATPCIWINPSNTFLAHGWDIILFFVLWRISVKRPQRFFPAAILIGIALGLRWVASYGYVDALGLDNQPMMAPLRVRQFFPFFMGFLVPVFYVFSLVWLLPRKSGTENQLPVVLCIYGLMIFINYIEHPSIGFYGPLMVPAVLVALWWFKQGLGACSAVLRRGISAGVLILAAGALFTNRLMLTYPNAFFQDPGRFRQEAAAYEHFDAVEQSAQLVRKLIMEDQKAALLTNFETAVLMQAHRRPLFRHIPVMFSGFSNSPAGLRLRTKAGALDLINSLQEENPPYVFVDRRLWALPPQDLGRTGLGSVMGYLRDHYQEYGHQGLLMALQRK